MSGVNVNLLEMRHSGTDDLDVRETHRSVAGKGNPQSSPRLGFPKVLFGRGLLQDRLGCMATQ